MFQAGASTWSKPIGVDKDSKKGLESQDEGVGILKYTASKALLGRTRNY